MSILSPFTTRSPRLTLASDGKPRLRLLVVSKPELFEVLLFRVHGTPPANEPIDRDVQYQRLACKAAHGPLPNGRAKTAAIRNRADRYETQSIRALTAANAENSSLP